ncbi:MAG: type IV pilus assembly protein PilM [Endozoicomonadaceae bacterium]|nr:type IV pilus assembly protein PilM [Endozoicomonadaceae bacterium]
MLSLFRKRQNTMLGVDIDSLSLSLLELTSEGDTFRVEAYAREVLPQSGQITKNTKTEDTVDIEAQSQCLEQMIKKGKFSTKKAVSAVSSSNIITKQLIMDGSLNDEEIENQIILEAERIIPYSIEEVSIDFDVLGKNENDDTKINVLLVACRRQIVDERESLLNLAGLKPQIIDVTTYAMERAYPLIASQLQLKKADSRVALVHIGDLFITLNVLQNGDSIWRQTLCGAS